MTIKNDFEHGRAVENLKADLAMLETQRATCELLAAEIEAYEKKRWPFTVPKAHFFTRYAGGTMVDELDGADEDLVKPPALRYLTAKELKRELKATPAHGAKKPKRKGQK